MCNPSRHPVHIRQHTLYSPVTQSKTTENETGNSVAGTLANGFSGPTGSRAGTTLIQIQELMNLLPHRYPMLLVDKIIEINEENTKCKGIKNVTINEPFFQGHYPGNPIMPGVLIVESMAQVGASLLLQTDALKNRIPLIGNIDNVKFRRMVRPGDQLVIEIELIWVKGNVGKIAGVATVEGEMAAQMEMVFKLSDRNKE